MSSLNLWHEKSISKEALSKQSQKYISEIAEILSSLQLNPIDTNLPLVLLEKQAHLDSLKYSYNAEVKSLERVQKILKESFLTLNALENIESSYKRLNTEEKTSVALENKYLEEKIKNFKNNYYDEKIDHKTLLRLSDECEGLAKELVTLQEKHELYGDFPTVTHT